MVATISRVNSLTLHNKYNKTYRKITKNDEKKHFFFKKMLFFCTYLEQIIFIHSIQINLINSIRK